MPAWAHVSPEQIAEAKRYGVPVAFENERGMRFVLVPSGTFTMGEPHTEYPGTYRDFATAHDVTISQPFYLGMTEVRCRDYRGMDPDHRVEIARERLGDRQAWSELGLDGDELPVTQVTWEAAVSFAAWLSEKDPRRSYRLPTEAEWERACRAGTDGRLPWPPGEVARRENIGDESLRMWIGDDVVWTEYRNRWPIPVAELWHLGDDGHVGPCPVASFTPSRWGLYDMLGNVSEWCGDWFGPYPTTAVIDPQGASRADSHKAEFPWMGGEQPVVPGLYSPAPSRVIRGASWRHGPAHMRCAVRGSEWPDRASIGVGFRLVSPLRMP